MLKRHPGLPFPSIGSILAGLRRGSERAGITAEPSAGLEIRHRVYWNEGAIRWSEEPGGDTDAAFVSVPLETDQACRFRITAPKTDLAALAVRVGTYRRINVGSLSCRLHRPFGTVLAWASTDLTTLQDNAFQAVLDLQGVALEAGQDYWVELALTADPGNEIALYAAVPEIGPLIPHRRLEGFNSDREFEIESVKGGLLPRYRLDWSQDDALWSTWPTVPGPEASLFEPYALKFREAFEFEIVATVRRSGILRVQLATFEQRVKGHVAVELLGPTDDPLLRNALDLSHVTDNSFVPVLDLAGADLEPGRKYRVRLHWYGSMGNVAVYAGPVTVGRYELRPHLESLSPDRLFTEAAWGRVAQVVRKAFLIATPGDLERSGTLLAGVRRIFPDLGFAMLTFEEASKHLAPLRRAEVVVFADMFHLKTHDGLSFDDLCFDLHRNLVCTIFVDQHGGISPAEGVTCTPSAQTAMSHRRQHARRCHYVVSGERRTVEATWPGAPARAGEVLDPERLAQLVEAVRARARPRVAVVSVLHRKADLIELFLEHVRDQTYPGEITTVLVDDASPEDDASRAMRFAGRLRDAGLDNRRVLIHSNDGNLGNCASRLAGLSGYEADIYVIVDCDCLMNRDFIAAHVFEHWWDDVDAVIGPHNIESDGRDPRALVAMLEADADAVLSESQLQDPLQPAGFLNCITRNFSIKHRRVREEPLFDLDFSYSAKPGSGFGWEDVEMGYRLYIKGAVVRFTERAFVVHCSHASSIPDDRKMVGSTRNFAKLFQKHPELSLVARRWATDTYDRIVGWQEMLGASSGPERLQLDRTFGDSRRKLGGVLPLLRGQGRKLRILTYRWHAAHQYELYKLPHAFTLATRVGSPATDVWSYEQRPLPRNARLVPFAELDLRDYDLALLHFDENVLAAHLCNGVIPASWGDAFRHFLDIDSLPKIAVCHGTVPFEGQFALDTGRKHAFEPHEDERRTLVDTLSGAGISVVCNSHQALDEWGFKDARVIWHGFDPQEFPRGTLARDVLALQADFARPHYRGAWELEEVLSHLAPGIRVETASHPGAPIENRLQNPFAVRNFRSYVDRIRQFKFYLNTTLRSPMPRSRGEAMMTGVIPVCLRNHDVDMFIENGVDGFYADRPEDLASFINDTIMDPARLEAMSLAARRKALDVFNQDRYLAEWQSLLIDIV